MNEQNKSFEQFKENGQNGWFTNYERRNEKKSKNQSLVAAQFDKQLTKYHFLFYSIFSTEKIL